MKTTVEAVLGSGVSQAWDYSVWVVGSCNCCPRIGIIFLHIPARHEDTALETKPPRATNTLAGQRI